jgi:hypothetical protein
LTLNFVFNIFPSLLAMSNSPSSSRNSSSSPSHSPDPDNDHIDVTNIENASPFDLDSLEDALIGEDSPDQNEVLLRLNQYADPTTQADIDYNDLPISNISLVKLQRIFEEKKVAAALSNLKKRLNIEINPILREKPTDPLLCWNASGHFLDFLLIVPSVAGMQAVLPNLDHDNRYCFKINFSRQFVEWRSHFGKLGFDPNGRMLHIGQWNTDSIWMAWVPNSFFEKDSADVPAGYKTGSSLLSKKHYRMIMYFFAFLFNKMAFKDITLRTPYPNLKDDTIIGYTNLM